MKKRNIGITMSGTTMTVKMTRQSSQGSFDEWRNSQQGKQKLPERYQTTKSTCGQDNSRDVKPWRDSNKKGVDFGKTQVIGIQYKQARSGTRHCINFYNGY